MGATLLWAVGLMAAGWGTALPCPDGADRDEDGISDACELSLAMRFAPILVVSEAACNWNVSQERLEGGYLFGVFPTMSGYRIAYLPAYLMDCGWAGPKCLVRFRGGCDPHVADSELIVVEVEQVDSEDALQATRVFLSAHCFGRRDDGCRWAARSELHWLEDHPYVWVAEGKNANYSDRSACDSGQFHYDTCDRNQRSLYFPIRSEVQNIGSAETPFPAVPLSAGCVTPADLPHLADLPASTHSLGSECIWTDPFFRGWGGPEVQGATGYRRYLDEIVEVVP